MAKPGGYRQQQRGASSVTNPKRCLLSFFCCLNLGRGSEIMDGMDRFGLVGDVFEPQASASPKPGMPGPLGSTQHQAAPHRAHPCSARRWKVLPPTSCPPFSTPSRDHQHHAPTHLHSPHHRPVCISFQSHLAVPDGTLPLLYSTRSSSILLMAVMSFHFPFPTARFQFCGPGNGKPMPAAPSARLLTPCPGVSQPHPPPR
jgi:hypothetical protein